MFVKFIQQTIKHEVISYSTISICYVKAPTMRKRYCDLPEYTDGVKLCQPADKTDI